MRLSATFPISIAFLLSGLPHLLCAGASSQDANSPKQRVPEVWYLVFPVGVEVETIYTYPSEIAFRPRSGIAPRTKLIARFLEITDKKSVYERVVNCTYCADDQTFWIELPEDLPKKTSIHVIAQENARKTEPSTSK